MSQVTGGAAYAPEVTVSFGVDGGQATPVSASNPLPVFGSMPFNGTSTPLAANATFTGAARDSGADSGLQCPYAYFNAFAYADQTGTLSIEGSWDNATWTKVAQGALSVATPLTLQIPVMFRYHRVKLLNGATLQGAVQVSTCYTAS